MDRVTPGVRSATMSRVRSADTGPERIVASILAALGLKFTSHAKDLPGRPDIVLRRRKKVIFVHGCFWHRHARCRKATQPSSNRHYWLPKLRRNVRRDRENQAALTANGWQSIVIWECELRDRDAVLRRLINFVESSRTAQRISSKR